MRIEKIITLESTDSTNNYIKNLNPPGTLCVRALTQSAGRGRLGRSFLSPKGGLYFSVIASERENRDIITLMAALAVQGCIPGSAIKWPNDLLIDGKKVCGILCEGNNCDSRVIIGIGINVSSAPVQGACRTGGDAEKLFYDVLKSLEKVFSALENGERSALLEQYNEHLLMRGTAVTVYNGQSQISGEALGIDDDGALLVRSDRLYRISSGEATFKK